MIGCSTDQTADSDINKKDTLLIGLKYQELYVLNVDPSDKDSEINDATPELQLSGSARTIRRI